MLFFLTILSLIGFGSVMAQNGPPPEVPQIPEIPDLPPPGTQQGNYGLESNELPLCVLTPGENGEHGPCSRDLSALDEEYHNETYNVPPGTVPVFPPGN